MKQLIADSGSTKTEWALVDGNKMQTVFTAGINPVHMTAGEMESILTKEFTLPVTGIDSVWFYGAGCIPSKCVEVTGVLRRFFGTERIAVDTDLLGAAHSLFGHRPGVACILGTGSNSALYDGKQIEHNIPPLGYVLGDEGSGANLGKRLIGNLLKGFLPPDLTEAFYEAHRLEYAGIIESVYRKPGANRFLADFCPFLYAHIAHPAIRGIVEQAFSDFVERNLLPYNGVRELPISFTGSVAYYFAEPLRAVLAHYGLAAERIWQSPMEGLIQYHRHRKQNN